MSLQAIKAEFRQFINDHQPIDPYELRRIFSEVIREWEMEKGWDETRKGESWTDDELRSILGDAPTRENCLTCVSHFPGRFSARPGPVFCPGEHIDTR